ncbi:MAG: OsmC family protein [Bacteroidetes bacterium]|nr:OsmC family protein [Bacteroidota bacterium]
MITSRTVYIGNLRTEMTHLQSESEVITDAPIDNQGKGEKFSPTDLVATSLSSCMLTIMGIAANTHHFNIDGTIAEVTKVMASNPRRISEIHINLSFPHNNYSEREKKHIKHAAFTCPVSQSLHPNLKQVITFNYPENE